MIIYGLDYRYLHPDETSDGIGYVCFRCQEAPIINAHGWFPCADHAWHALMNHVWH